MMKSTRSKTAARALRRWLPKLLFGTASSTYATCGQPSCLCHRDSTKRHGPYLHVSYREAGGTRGYSVPAALRPRVLGGLRAWQQVQRRLRALAEQNRRALGLGPKARRAR